MTRTILIVTLLCIAIASARLAFLHDYPEWDQSTYFLIGDALLHGKHLYVDIWDIKPPAIFATYAIANALTGISFAWTGYVLSVITSVGAMIGVYFAAARWNRTAGLLGATFFAVVSIEPALGGPIPNTESFINLFVAIGFAVWMWRGERTDGALLAGSLFALATLYKQVALAPALAIAIVNILAPPPAVLRRSAASRSALLLAPILIVWILAFGYFAISGRAQIFLQTVFVYPLFYASQAVAAQRDSFAWISEMLPLLFIALFALTKWNDRRCNSLAAFFVGAALAVALPHRAFPHYFQMLLIPLAIAAAIGSTFLLNRRETVFRILPPLALLGLTVLQAHWYFITPRERAALQHPASFFLNVAVVGDEIRSMLHADETMYCWCDEPELYVLANKRAPAAALWKAHAVSGPLAATLTARTVADLRAHPPDLMVLWAGYPGPEDHPIYRMIIDGYDPLPGNANRLPLGLWARRGSDLQRRALAAHDK